MDKETLSNYGWIVICVLVLAVMLALATPFGTFVADGFKATYTGLFDTGDSALDVGLNAVGVKNTLECGHGRKESGDHTQKECGHYNCQDECGCVPASCGVEGHWSNDGKDHSAATSCSKHDYVCQCDGWVVPEGGKYITNLSLNGTGKTYNAGDRLPCDYVVTKYDEYMEGNYYYKYQGQYYYWSDKWADSGDGHGWGVYCYKDIENPGPMLENINGQPITNLYCAFSRCVSLTISPIIPSTVKNVEYAYMGTKIIHAPIISEGVTSLNSTFYRCTELVSAPRIPSSVTNMNTTFFECTKLVGTIVVDGTISNYGSCFRDVDMSKITLAGSCNASLKQTLANTGKNGSLVTIID